MMQAHYDHSVLLGSAGTGTAFAAATALRRVWSQSVQIVAMDINPRHLVTTSLLADVYEQVPLFASLKFKEVLLGLLDAHKVDAYLPLFPEEIVLASTLRESGQMGGAVTLLGPAAAAAVLCADKIKLSELLGQYGIPVPKTAVASQPFEADEFFLKPKDGTGSRGARKIKAADLPLIIGDLSSWVLQEICGGPEVTVDAFFDPVSGFCHAVCRERIEIKSGVSTKCRLFGDETLVKIASAIASVLHLSGSFCFQVMRNREDWGVIDVNPRPGAATAMSVATGNDFFAATFALGWGEETSRFFRPLKEEFFVTRQYAEFLMPAL